MSKINESRETVLASNAFKEFSLLNKNLERMIKIMERQLEISEAAHKVVIEQYKSFSSSHMNQFLGGRKEVKKDGEPGKNDSEAQ